MVTWDEAKRRANLAKHGLDLADAVVFDFDAAVFEEDRDIGHEQRFRAMGWVRNRLCFLVYTLEGEDVHAISLRACDRKERRRYAAEIRSLHRR